MAYSERITRDNPSCIVFLVDQSSSMSKGFGAQPGKKKADGVADPINKLLQTLCIRCGRADGIYDYLEIGVIGYGQHVQPALGGALAGRELISIGELAAQPLRVETREKLIDDGVGGILKRQVVFPIWFEPTAAGKTPMREALELAGEWVSEFLTRRPNCFPPQVINLTDGESNDDPFAAANALKQLHSSDGNVLLWNAHLSELKEPEILFPDQEQGLPNEFAKTLFRMSSALPPSLIELARQDEFDVGSQSRAFVFNADLVAMIRFLDFGTLRTVGGNTR